MPPFTADQISEGELEEIVEFITGTESADGHSEPMEMAADEALAMHHWMALLALKEASPEEATHHVEHIVDLADDAEHRRSMSQVMEDLNAGRLHEAEHVIEGMLAGTAEPELGLAELHLQIALSSLSVHDPEDVRHHLAHYAEVTDAVDRSTAQAILDDIEAGRLHDGEAAIKQLLEGMPHQHHHH
jgi:hypothetical protein